MLTDARKSTRPLLIAARTTIGFGAPKKAGTEKVHGSPLGAEELAAAKAKLGIDYPAFEVPQPILETWRAAGSRASNEVGAWGGPPRRCRARVARRVRAAHCRQAA